MNSNPGLRNEVQPTYTPRSHTSAKLVSTRPTAISVTPLADRPGVHLKQARSFLIVDADSLPALIAAIREVAGD